MAAPPEKERTEARQGITGTGTRYVLAISLTAIVILFGLIVFAFYGEEEDMTVGPPGDSGAQNPPYTAPLETPDWQEPAPVDPPENPAPGP